MTNHHRFALHQTLPYLPHHTYVRLSHEHIWLGYMLEIYLVFLSLVTPVFILLLSTVTGILLSQYCIVPYLYSNFFLLVLKFLQCLIREL